jgi:hypothetical protein
MLLNRLEARRKERNNILGEGRRFTGAGTLHSQPHAATLQASRSSWWLCHLVGPVLPINAFYPKRLSCVSPAADISSGYLTETNGTCDIQFMMLSIKCRCLCRLVTLHTPAPFTVSRAQAGLGLVQ